jgi:hypothetical protein
MNKLIMLVCLFLLLFIVGCTDSDNATRVLRSQGYTNIKITGYCLFGCSKDDGVHTGFKAKAPNGEMIEGVVCQGLLLKGATVRIK